MSHAYLPEVDATEFSRELEDVDHRMWLPVTVDRWQQLKNAAADDPVQQKLREVIRRGWPENRAQTPECVCPYFDVRDELTIQDKLIFKRSADCCTSSDEKGTHGEDARVSHWY